MKKLYFILFIVFGGLLVSNAQVTLFESIHAPVNGDMYEMYQIDSAGVLPGSSGSSAVWNFTSTPTRTTVLVNNTFTVASAIPSGSLYPSTSIAKTNAAGNSFYTSNASQLNYWGGNIKIGLISADYYFNSPAIHAAYPMSFNTTTTSAFSGMVTSALGSGPISGGTSTVIADGQGTLNLPSRSFTNVLRVKTNTSFNFTVVVLVTTTVTGSVEQESYDYYSSLTTLPSNKVNPLFSITSSTIISSAAATQTGTTVFINKDYEYVGINESSKEIASLNIFPNPTKNNFVLSLVNENSDAISYEIVNTLGQTIIKDNLGNNKGSLSFSINISDLQAGVYFVKVKAGLKFSTKKINIQ